MRHIMKTKLVAALVCGAAVSTVSAQNTPGDNRRSQLLLVHRVSQIHEYLIVLVDTN